MPAGCGRVPISPAFTKSGQVLEVSAAADNASRRYNKSAFFA